jgi:hypothetical protein
VLQGSFRRHGVLGAEVSSDGQGWASTTAPGADPERELGYLMGTGYGRVLTEDVLWAPGQNAACRMTGRRSAAARGKGWSAGEYALRRARLHANSERWLLTDIERHTDDPRQAAPRRRTAASRASASGGDFAWSRSPAGPPGGGDHNRALVPVDAVVASRTGAFYFYYANGRSRGGAFQHDAASRAEKKKTVRALKSIAERNSRARNRVARLASDQALPRNRPAAIDYGDGRAPSATPRRRPCRASPL